MLAITMLLSVLAGCNNSTTTEPTASDSPSQSQPAETTAPSSEPSASQEAQPPSDENPPPPSEEAPPEEPVKKTITYPLTDPSSPYVITLWCEFVSVFEQYISSFNDMPLMPAVREATGVDYQYVEVSQAAATERFNLMMVSQEWTDIIRAADYYTGGLAAAYNDEVVLDLTELIPEYAPDYYDILINTNQDTVDMVMTSGMYLQMNTIQNATISDRGMVTRGDWLEALNLSAPTNLQEFTDALYAIHTEYNTPKTYYLSSNGAIQYINNAFDLGGFDVSGNSTGVGIARDGDTLYSALISDATRAYVEWFNELYNDGIFQDDFYTNADNENTIRANVAKGEAGFWPDAADAVEMVTAASDDPNIAPLPMGLIYDENGKYTYGSVTTMADNKGYSVTTTCEYPEVAVSFFNYFFTEEGMLLANYGTEGDTFNYDENGKPKYTDAIMNDPAYFAPFMAIVVKCFSQAPIYNDALKLMDTYSETALEAIDIWSDRTNVTAEHNIPNGAALTADETNEIATTMADIVAYTAETLLNFMTASAPPTDDEWAKYVEQCEKFGLSKCVKVYQGAYDAYLERKNA